MKKRKDREEEEKREGRLLWERLLAVLGQITRLQLARRHEEAQGSRGGGEAGGYVALGKALGCLLHATTFSIHPSRHEEEAREEDWQPATS